MHPLLHHLDPRRSLAAAVGWLVTTLSIAIAIVAAAWLGVMARSTVLQQHARQLTLTADQFSGELDVSLSSRLQALRAAAAMLRTEVPGEAPRALRAVLADLQSAYPELAWIGFATANGMVTAATGGLLEGSSVAARLWFAHGLKGPWIGGPHVAVLLDEKLPRPANDEPRRLADLTVPVRGSDGRVAGVLGAHLSWTWLESYARELRASLHLQQPIEAMVVDDDHRIVFGPNELQGTRWSSTPLDDASLSRAGERREKHGGAAAFERLDDGRVRLVSRIDPPTGGALQTLGWHVQLSEPADLAYQRADALWLQILGASLALGAAAALVGVLVARRLTRRLMYLTRSVEAVESGAAQRIEAPSGIDEAARLGTAFSAVLDALNRERSELRVLGEQLEQRVAARTREVERLAEETRYAAVVRERLKIARDLHDTLAHSMMAMLSEMRLLRKLHVHDPGSLAAELGAAEQAAHEGLKEARAAIAQMRFNPVRDAGLGAALGDAIRLYAERTALAVKFVADPEAARFADERAETLFRIAEEALRNVERHARASQVTVRLQRTVDESLELSIEDDGVGFDPAAAHPGHYGLTGLREQVCLIGAKLTIESAQHRGTVVRVVLTTSRGEATAVAPA